MLAVGSRPISRAREQVRGRELLVRRRVEQHEPARVPRESGDAGAVHLHGRRRRADRRGARGGRTGEKSQFGTSRAARPRPCRARPSRETTCRRGACGATRRPDGRRSQLATTGRRLGHVRSDRGNRRANPSHAASFGGSAARAQSSTRAGSAAPGPVRSACTSTRRYFADDGSVRPTSGPSSSGPPPGAWTCSAMMSAGVVSQRVTGLDVEPSEVSCSVAWCKRIAPALAPVNRIAAIDRPRGRAGTRNSCILRPRFHRRPGVSTTLEATSHGEATGT